MAILHLMRLLTIFIIVVTSFSATASTPQQAFRHQIKTLLEEHRLPGVVVHVRHHNKLLMHEAIGLVNVDKEEALKTNSMFRIYSMTKPLTAVALLQLVDQGLVNLNEDIRTYLPQFDTFEFDGQQRTVTVHHLLAHTAGFGYGGGLKSWVDFRYLIANPLSRNNTLKDMIDDLSGIDLKFTSGERFEYSIASDIQGAIIEAVTHQSLEQYFQKNLFNPLNMKDTHFAVPESKAARFVDMYEYDAGTFEKAHVFDKEKILFVESATESDFLKKPTLLSGGGGLISTAQDYANFVQMLLNKGIFENKRIVSENLVETMLSSHTRGLDTHFLPRVYRGVGFGYGLGIKETSGDLRKEGSFFWGGMGGTIFWADPQSDLQVVVMFQVEDGWIAMEKWMVPHVYEMLESLSKKDS